MKQKILNIVAIVALAATLVLAPAAPVSAACTGGNSAKGQVLQGVGQTGNDCDGSAVESTIKAVVNILAYLAGIIAVIMIIISGYKYITSNGDTGKISSAKTTLIYALVGVAVVALSQFLVHFVLGGILK